MDPCVNAIEFNSQKILPSYRPNAVVAPSLGQQSTRTPRSSSHVTQSRSLGGSVSPRHRNRRPQSSPKSPFSFMRSMSPNPGGLNNVAKSHSAHMPRFKGNVQQENNSQSNYESTVESNDIEMYIQSTKAKNSVVCNLRKNVVVGRSLWRRPMKQLYRPFMQVRLTFYFVDNHLMSYFVLKANVIAFASIIITGHKGLWYDSIWRSGTGMPLRRER